LLVEMSGYGRNPYQLVKSGPDPDVGYDFHNTCRELAICSSGSVAAVC
jgi:hypothetical protein